MSWQAEDLASFDAASTEVSATSTAYEQVGLVDVVD
jgi:hypothetical protein